MTYQTPPVTWYDEIRLHHRPIEVTEELLNEALNVLPPIYATGCFGVGEPKSHNDRNQAERHWFSQRGGKCWGYLGTRSEAESAFPAFYNANGIKLTPA